MTFDVLTYQAGESDLSLTASAPAISGRPSLPKEGKAAGEAGPTFAMRLWLMLSFQIMAYFAKVKAVNPSAEFVLKYSAPGETSGQYISVTLNRRLRRKLARLQRLGRMNCGDVAVHEPSTDDDLTRTQCLDKMIRTQKWDRVRVFGLGMTRRARQAHVMTFAGLKGDVQSLQRALSCHARLSPD